MKLWKYLLLLLAALALFGAAETALAAERCPQGCPLYYVTPPGEHY